MKHMHIKIFAITLMLAFCAHYRAYSELALDPAKPEATEEHIPGFEEQTGSGHDSLDNPAFLEDIEKEKEQELTGDEPDEPTITAHKDDENIQRLPNEENRSELAFNREPQTGIQVKQKIERLPQISLNVWQKFVAALARLFGKAKPIPVEAAVFEAEQGLENVAKSLEKTSTETSDVGKTSQLLSSLSNSLRSSIAYIVSPDANDATALNNFLKPIQDLLRLGSAKTNAALSASKELFEAQVNTVYSIADALNAFKAKWPKTDLKQTDVGKEFENLASMTQDAVIASNAQEKAAQSLTAE